MATIVVPPIIIWSSDIDIDLVPALFGGALLVGGSGLVAWTVKLFVTIGRGTLAPWDATTRLVVSGYFPLVEEPGLSRRFGSEYEDYREHVPRWLPRMRPWRA